MKPFTLKLLRLSACATVLMTPLALATDHVDPPSIVADPVADILDLYAFMNPVCEVVGGTGCEAPPEELILAMTVHPDASGSSKFSSEVKYHFHFENDVGTSRKITCSFSADQMVSCSGLDGLSVEGAVGETVTNGNLRVFTGLRDDPSFMDVAALQNFAQIGIPAFTDPGTDSFAGHNVLAIVLGIKNAGFPAGSGATDSNGHAINVQKIWVSSERSAGSASQGGISGSWYNPQQDGMGWVIEVISTPAGNAFLFYFYGYDDDGNRTWLIGITPEISGSTVVVEALLFTGTGFGGNFDPGSVSNEVVGTVTFEFFDCDNGQASFVSTKEGLDSFSAPMTRISNIASASCEFGSAVQMDRMGRALTGFFVPDAVREAYNADSNPSSWVASYSAGIQASLTSVDLADGVEGNPLNPPATMAPIMADDRLSVDLEWAACGGLYTIEFSDLVPQPHTNDCGGRSLEQDVLDEVLSIVVSGFDPFVSDFVDANDKAFLEAFPFLAEPH